MWLAKLLLGVFFTSVVACTPTSSRDNTHEDSGRILTTGVPSRTADGNVPIRREINDLKNNFPEQWNLYLLGLRSFQLNDEKLDSSFYQIAGIHGRPYKVWQGAEGISSKLGGYCPHKNNLFFGWHRAYLALYEQELYKHVQSVALKFDPDLIDRYASAADELRIPYWDWALGTKAKVPEFFITPTIQVIGFDGSEQTIPNPLHHYEFPSNIAEDFRDTWAHQNHTLRWPNSNSSDAQSQDQKFVAYFNARRREFLDKVSNGFTWARNMNEFSYKFIEDIHGIVHFAIGSSSPENNYDGHMWPTDYSAFEPLFMLHHCNVDRLFALWEASRPSLFIESFLVARNGNYWIADDSTTDANTPLLPFWLTPSSFWTTNDVRDSTVLGYAYPETQSWKYDSEGAYRAAINATISQLYSSSVRGTLTTGVGENGGVLEHVLDDDTFIDWVVHIHGSHDQLPATFNARFSLVGDFSSDAITDVGTWTVLASASSNADAKKIKHTTTSEPDISGMVSLTATLLDQISAGKLESLGVGDVVPFLKDKLTWKVYAGDGTFVANSDLGDLMVEVASTKVRIPDDPNRALEYSDESTSYPEITTGKVGGSKARTSTVDPSNTYFLAE